jgi:hypothetical protein
MCKGTLAGSLFLGWACPDGNFEDVGCKHHWLRPLLPGQRPCDTLRSLLPIYSNCPRIGPESRKKLVDEMTQMLAHLTARQATTEEETQRQDACAIALTSVRRGLRYAGCSELTPASARPAPPPAAPPGAR